MPEAEQKQCPRCGAGFACHRAAVAQCPCRKVELTAAQRAFMATHYDDCLCPACLQQMQREGTS
jgi:hypothetical protein